jgi:hypothetical protein
LCFTLKIEILNKYELKELKVKRIKKTRTFKSIDS